MPREGRRVLAADRRGVDAHALRHTHRTLLVELGVPTKPIDERIGHEDGSVQGPHTHVTSLMRERLMEDLTGLWEAALDARRQTCATSPVQALGWLLRRPRRGSAGSGHS